MAQGQVKGHLLGQMEMSTPANIRTVKNMVREHSPKQMEMSTKVNGRITSEMVREHLQG